MHVMMATATTSAILYFLAAVHSGQMTVTTGLTHDECGKAARTGDSCFRYLPNTAGTTFVYKLEGDPIITIVYGVATSPPPAETCQIFLNNLDPTVPAACVPVPLATEDCGR
jgi:hypothetical protein